MPGSPKIFYISNRHPQTVGNPRVQGYAFGFDLPSPEALGFMVATRMWRGYMVYGAGQRTLRFRLHRHMSERSLKALFERLDAALTAYETESSTEWQHVAQPDEPPSWPQAVSEIPASYRIESVSSESRFKRTDISHQDAAMPITSPTRTQ